MTSEECYKVVEEQIRLLTEWNKENAKTEPEQVRENIKVILTCVAVCLS